jgi:hypothetical protein
MFILFSSFYVMYGGHMIMFSNLFTLIIMLSSYDIAFGWYKEKFEDTKWVIRSRKSKDRQYSDQKKKDKR